LWASSVNWASDRFLRTFGLSIVPQKTDPAALRAIRLTACAVSLLTLLLIAADMLVTGQNDLLYGATLISAVATCALLRFFSRGPSQLRPKSPG
jgi:hypothetical protein